MVNQSLIKTFAAPQIIWNSQKGDEKCWHPELLSGSLLPLQIFVVPNVESAPQQWQAAKIAD